MRPKPALHTLPFAFILRGFPVRMSRLKRIPEEIIDPIFASCAVGVGNKKQALSCVWGTEGTRGYNRPFRVIPDGGQVADDNVKSEINEV